MIDNEDGEDYDCDQESDYYIGAFEDEDNTGAYNDLHNFKGVYEAGEDDGGQKFQDPETGSHFEYLDMCHRMKKLQVRRGHIDRQLEEEEKKKKDQ